MPEEVTIHEAKTHLSRLVRRAEGGEEIVIQRGRTPVAKLVGYQAAPLHRRPGRLRGEIQLAEDFDTLPEEVARTFEAES